MARKTVVTPAVEALIEKHREPGLTLKQLHARIGGAVSEATLWRYLQRSTIAERAARITEHLPPEAAEAKAALESDDLDRLVRVRDDLISALDRWRLSLGADGGSVRAYVPCARLLGDITARLIELRPRAEVEAERLGALGAKGRDALIARAREVALADEDLRGRIRRQQDVINSLIDQGAD